jgi:hypothetical protein
MGCRAAGADLAWKCVTAPLPMTHDAPLVDPSARDALRRAVAMLDDAETRARPFEMSQALAAVARCYRDLRAIDSAEATFAAALRWAHLSGSKDQVVDLLCELAETTVQAVIGDLNEPSADASARHAARERARDRAFHAARLASEVADPRWEVRVLLRASQVLEQCGDHEDAVRLQSRALRRQAGGGRSAADAAQLPGAEQLADH